MDGPDSILSRNALETKEEVEKLESLEDSLSSLNKVRFESVSMHGREEQRAALAECLKHHIECQQWIELVAIEGLSGM